jgi:hypothetical protein
VYSPESGGIWSAVITPGDLITYVQNAIQHSLGDFPTLRRLRDKSWPLAVIYGVAVSGVAIDRTAYVHMPYRRAPEIAHARATSRRLASNAASAAKPTVRLRGHPRRVARGMLGCV